MISFSRSRHQLIYSFFNIVIIVDDRRTQLFNVVVLDDNRVIIIERRCSRRQSSNNNWTSLIETFVESKLSLLSFWLRAHAFILRYVLHQIVKNILQRREFQAVYSIVNLLISTNKEIFIDDHFFFFFNSAEIIENYAFWILRRLNEHFKYSLNVSWWFDENHARSVWRLFSVSIDERHIKFT
jgi:hypothetical protein